MNRCNPRLLAALLLAAFTGFLGLPATAQTEDVKANVRQFPGTAARGELMVLMAPDISMNGKADRLSPAVRIRDINNNLVLSGTLANQRLVVNYVRDNIGLVQQVWILNSEEARLKRPGEDGGILSNIRSMFDAPVVSDDGKTPYHKLPSYKQ